jgi:hypothetical protein
VRWLGPTHRQFPAQPGECELVRHIHFVTHGTASRLSPLDSAILLSKDGDDYHWETCSKTAGIMSLIFDFVDHNEIYSIRNPMDKVTIPASEEEHPEIRLLSPDEVFSLIKRLPNPIDIAVLLVAAARGEPLGNLES